MISNGEAVLEALRKRRSVRSYRKDAIEKDVLIDIIETARYSPSGMNRQNLRITVVKDERLQKDIIDALKEVLKDEEYNGFYEAPYFVLFSAPEKNTNGFADCACYAMNFMNAAYVYGLGTVWVNQMKNKCHETGLRKVLDNLDIPEDHVVWTCLSLGYPAEPLPEDRENVSEYRII